MSYCSDTLPKLEAALKRSWNKETCYLPMQEQWTSENPAFGQRVITALIVQDFFGGEILFCEYQNHFWNQLPDGIQIDLTRSQFPPDTVIYADGTAIRHDLIYSEEALNVKTLIRYLDLKRRVILIL